MFDASDNLDELSDALRALDESTAEIARLREDRRRDALDGQAALDEANAKIARLREALKKYGQHDRFCPWVVKGWGEPGPCICGFEAASDEEG